MASSRRADRLRLAVAVDPPTVQSVVMDGRDRLLAHAALDTTEDLAATLASVIRRATAGPGVDPALVTHAMLATGELTRALENLAVDRVAVIRIGSPLTHAVPPLTGWPPLLRDAVSSDGVVVGGGAEYDGRAAARLDEDRIARFLDTLGDDIHGVAITGIFSAVAPDHELAAAAVVRRELGPHVRVSLSHELGTLGLLERENATVLNAALNGAVGRVGAALEHALRVERIRAEVFLARHDGALMALQFAERLPVLMLGSGPASAMRGAVHLTGVDDAVVVHASRSATTIGTVEQGLPREMASVAEVAGVRVGFRLPEIRSLPPDADSAALAEAVDWARADLRTPPVLAVGCTDHVGLNHVPGVGRVLRPAAGEIAAAVGAAIGEVRGRGDRISPDRQDRRRQALEAAQDAAIALAVHAGADPGQLQVVGIDETALTYDIEPVVRVGVKVAGPPG